LKKTNMDLVVGGSILVALFILIAGVLWLKDVSVTRKLVTYTALFPNVGTLQLGDPVMANGVTKGNVLSIELRGSQVAVVIEVDKSLNLTDSCRIIVQNIGLMGERGIGIQLSSKGTTFHPSAKSDTTFIPGYFDTGIAEAMGMLGEVLGEVQTLVKNANAVVNSTVGDTSFLKVFDKLVIRLDSISEITENILQKNQPLLNNSIQNINTVTSELKSLLNRSSSNIDTIVQNGAALTSYALIVANRIDTLAVSVQNVVDQVDSGKGSIGMLMKDEQFYRDLKATVGDLDTLINEVKYDALKLRVKIGFGKKKK
jgi:phospholipid/cholesterol/gamma-HCH transport system substrate-binding protein